MCAIRKKSPKKQIQEKHILPIFWQLWLVFGGVKWMEINVAKYVVRGAMPHVDDSVATGVMDLGFTGVIDISVATGEGSM